MNRKYIYVVSAIAIICAIFLFNRTERVRSSANSTELVLATTGDPQVLQVPKVPGAMSSGTESHRIPSKRAAFRLPDAASLPDGNLAGNLSFLTSEAYSGHPEIAYALARDLFTCFGKPQNGASKFPTNPSTSFEEKCRGLTSQNYESAVKLLTYAAQNGDVNAQNTYLGYIGRWIDQHPELQYQSNFASNYAQNSLTFLQRAATSGNVDAMVTLANAYNRGIITSRNPVDAYAYMYSATKSGLIPASQRVLALWQSRLPPKDVSAGTSLGEDIYLNCCSQN